MLYRHNAAIGTDWNCPKLAWCGVKIDRMCTQCTLYSTSVLIIFCCFYLYNVHIKECIWQTYSTGTYNKKELANVWIQEQTASFDESNCLPHWKSNFRRLEIYLKSFYPYLQLILYKRYLECTLVHWRLSIYP